MIRDVIVVVRVLRVGGEEMREGPEALRVAARERLISVMMALRRHEIVSVIESRVNEMVARIGTEERVRG